MDAATPPASRLLQLRPRVGFGWLDAGAAADELTGDRLRSTFGYGIDLAYRQGELIVLGGLEHGVYRRAFLDPAPAPPGELAAPVELDEHQFGVAAAVGYDLAPALELRWNELSLVPYGGVQFQQYLNEVYPASLLGVVVGAEVRLLAARGLQFRTGADYTYNIGQHLFDATLPLDGAMLGLTRYRAELGIRFAAYTMLSFGYTGSWLTLEHSNLFEHSAMLGLTYGLEL